MATWKLFFCKEPKKNRYPSGISDGAGDVLTARDRPTNFPSEESTLTNHKTDLIIACFGMGNPSMAPKEFGF